MANAAQLYVKMKKAADLAINDYTNTPSVSALDKIDRDRYLESLLAKYLKQEAPRGWGWHKSPGRFDYKL